MEIFTGTGVAIVTPFDNNGVVDYSALEVLVNYQIDNGVDYIVALGTTGEPATLTSEEKIKVVDIIKKTNNRRVPLIIGFGSNNTQQLCEDIKKFDLSDVDGILSVTPYYSKPNQEGLYQHFMEVAKVSPLPIILYDVPGRSGVEISCETVLRLIESSDKFVAIKEASGDIDRAKRLKAAAPDYFKIISGNDDVITDYVELGGVGVISVAANVAPAYISKIVNHALAGEFDIAYEMGNKMNDFISNLFEEGNPTGIKAALAELGFISNRLRLPLAPTSEELAEKIRGSVQPFV